MSEIYSSNQVAERLGIAPGTVRTWKKRYEKQLIEGTHWVNQDGSTMWTQAGLEVLQGETASVLDNETASVLGNETASVLGNETVSVAELRRSETDDPLGRYSPLVESVSQAITQGLLTRIDKAVTGNIRTAIATPMTAQECVTVLTELGLKPCNPELLLTGNQPNLLTESKEN